MGLELQISGTEAGRRVKSLDSPRSDHFGLAENAKYSNIIQSRAAPEPLNSKSSVLGAVIAQIRKAKLHTQALHSQLEQYTTLIKPSSLFLKFIPV
jgi:hypothetical protein